MKVLGIITEYNPFHQGHTVHLQKSLKKSKADATICIMSGSFSQRGRPTIVNQWARTKMALKAGVNLVIQLPVCYTLRSAEYFSLGAVTLLESTGIVDYLCFGSELGNINPLKNIGKLLAQEPEQLSQLIKTQLKKGVSYPQARNNALIEYYTLNSSKIDLSKEQLNFTLSNPNNILALEYIKALTNLNSEITPLTIKRQGSPYHSTQLQKIASGSAIRNKIKANYKSNQSLLNKKLITVLPESTSKILKEEFNSNLGPIFYEQFSTSLLTLLRRINKSELKEYEGVIGGLENRIKDAAQQATSLFQLIELIKTKRFTQTRIQRILTQILLKLKQNQLNDFDQAGGPQYLRILGFDKQGRNLLKQIKQQATLPIITKVANHFNSKYKPKTSLQKMISYDIKANNIYNLAYSNNKAKKGNIDFYRSPILNF